MRDDRRSDVAGPAADARSIALTSDPVEDALARIRHVARTSSLQLALDVGEIVFDTIFCGDAAAFRSRGQKSLSFRRLALHPDLPMSASNLWRAVAIYELSLRFPALVQARHLGVSHVRAVLGLPPAEQERVLSRAERERWTPARVEAHAASRRRGQGGRPPKLEILKALDSLRRVATLPMSTFVDRAAVRRLSQEEVQVAIETLSELRERCVALQQLLVDARDGT